MASTLGRSTNTLANSLLNTSAHYDISNDMFAAFLSEDMTYSCPVWQHDPSESLEDAQERKLLRFVQGAKIKETDHVLEIGTGWGSFAIEAAKRTGCRVTSITLSQRQKELAEHRIKLAGLSHRIAVKFMDYRELPVPSEPFDKIISIEMLEAVGQAHLSDYFTCIHKLLKKDGIAMFQCITMPEGRHEAYSKSSEYGHCLLCDEYGANRENSFINQYIFPGGYLPSITQLLNHITTQSNGTLIVENVENIGGHYVKALRLWREAFLDNFDEKIHPALLKGHPTMTSEAVEVFRRKWEVILHGFPFTELS